MIDQIMKEMFAVFNYKNLYNLKIIQQNIRFKQ